MTRSDALRALLEKVEDGVDFTGHELNLAMDAIGPPYKDGVYATATYIRDAQRGSLDAAKALHEAVLPEYGWDIDSGCSASVWVVGRVPGKSRRYSVKQEYSATDNYNPARAWLIAILKALIATEDN